MNIRIASAALTSVMMIVIGFSSSTAEMYKWVDKDGIINISDTPPQIISESTKDERIIVNESATSYGSQEITPTQNPENKQTIKSTLDIELYTVSWCPYCKQAKEYLNSRGITYKEYDIEKDKDALKRKNELNPNGGVPVAVINGKIIRGFSSKTYDRVLAEQH